MQFETNRLFVRDFETGDLDSLIPLRADPEIAKFMDFEVESPAQACSWFARAIGYNTAVPRFSHHAAIILKETGQIVGWISMGYPENQENSIAERAFGYALGKQFWGKGLMPEAIRGMLRFCFAQELVMSVSAQCSKENRSSARCLEKAGMTLVKEFLSPRGKDGVSLLYVAYAGE